MNIGKMSPVLSLLPKYFQYPRRLKKAVEEAIKENA